MKIRIFLSVVLCVTTFGIFTIVNYLFASKKESPYKYHVVHENNLNDSIILQDSHHEDPLSPFVNIYSENLTGTFKKAQLTCGSKMIEINVHGNIMNGTPAVFPYREEDLMRLLEKIAKGKKLHFVDIGCNLGVHSLNMACRGYDVIAVDVNIENIKRLRHSALLNNLSDRIITINNAIADSHNFYNLSEAGDSERVTIVESKDDKRLIRGIFMDDLIPLIKYKNIIIKIDIEGSEVIAIRKSKLLFENFTVLAVFIEWYFIKHYPGINEVIELFRKYQLQPYNLQNEKLDIGSYKTWPINVVWKL